jgi:hypothetical protein
MTAHGDIYEKTERSSESTRLALRVWKIDRVRLAVYSLNQPAGRATWIASALARPTGGWPHDRPLAAECRRGGPHEDHGPGCDPATCKDHDPLPGVNCSCGIYAAKDVDVVSHYLRRDAPVLGLVELGGRVISAEQGYRARYARVAAVLLVDPALTIDHGTLRRLAGAYHVPALVPHSTDPENYRDRVTATSTLANEAEEYLRRQAGS